MKEKESKIAMDKIVMEANINPETIAEKIGKPITGTGEFNATGSPFSFIAPLKALMAKGGLEIVVELPSASEIDNIERLWTILRFQDGKWHGSLGPNESFKVTLDL